mgnify:CR=1 FL=1
MTMTSAVVTSALTKKYGRRTALAVGERIEQIALRREVAVRVGPRPGDAGGHSHLRQQL